MQLFVTSLCVLAKNVDPANLHVSVQGSWGILCEVTVAHCAAVLLAGIVSGAMTSPPVTVVQTGRALGAPGAWQVAFEVQNGGDGPVELLEAWLPHGRFRADAVPLTGHAPLAFGAIVRLAFIVGFDEPPGEYVENAFVILRVRWRGEVWRVLTRLSLTADVDGSPIASTELTTAHSVGFSQQE